MSKAYLINKVCELLKLMEQGYRENWSAEEINELYYEKERYEEYLLFEEKSRYEYYLMHSKDKYHDRCGDKELSKAIRESVEDTNEEEVRIFLDVCLKRIEELEDEFGETLWYERNIADCIQTVNTKYRHGEFGTDSTFCIDELENEGAWRTWQEPFISCLNRLARNLNLDIKYMF